MAGDVLGSGVNTAEIYTRDGKDRLAVLGAVADADSTGVTGLTWGRKLNDVSPATATLVGLPTGIRQSQLDRIHTWAHSLVKYRQGRRSWEGPISNIDRSKGGMTITAVDVSGWLTRRAIYRKRKTAKHVEVSVIDEMVVDINRGLFGDDPNVGSHKQVFHHASENTITRDVGKWSGYYMDDLKALAARGGNFTTLGRSIIVWPDQYVLGKLRVLDLDTFILGDIHVIESGDDLWTLTTGVNGDGKAASSRALNADVDTDGLSDYYGLHHRRLDAGDVKTKATIQRMARREQNKTYPTPNLITVPDGAQLDPSTPYAMRQLVAGIIIPAATKITGYRYHQPLVLDNLTVTAGPDGEAVTVGFTNPAADVEDGG